MKVLTISEAAKALPLSEKTLYRLALSGEAPFRKRGGRWMATEEDLLEWIRTGERGGRARTADPMPPSRGPKRPSIMELVNR